jgi:hypothetical protein
MNSESKNFLTHNSLSLPPLFSNAMQCKTRCTRTQPLSKTVNPLELNVNASWNPRMKSQPSASSTLCTLERYTAKLHLSPIFFTVEDYKAESKQWPLWQPPSYQSVIRTEVCWEACRPLCRCVRRICHLGDELKKFMKNKHWWTLRVFRLERIERV